MAIADIYKSMAEAVKSQQSAHTEEPKTETNGNELTASQKQAVETSTEMDIPTAPQETKGDSKTMEESYSGIADKLQASKQEQKQPDKIEAKEQPKQEQKQEEPNDDFGWTAEEREEVFKNFTPAMIKDMSDKAKNGNLSLVDIYKTYTKAPDPKQLEIDRKNADFKRGWEGLGNALRSVSEIYSAKEGAYIHPDKRKDMMAEATKEERKLEDSYKAQVAAYNKGIADAALKDFIEGAKDDREREKALRQVLKGRGDRLGKEALEKARQAGSDADRAARDKIAADRLEEAKRSHKANEANRRQANSIASKRISKADQPYTVTLFDKTGKRDDFQTNSAGQRTKTITLDNSAIVSYANAARSDSKFMKAHPYIMHTDPKTGKVTGLKDEQIAQEYMQYLTDNGERFSFEDASYLRNQDSGHAQQRQSPAPAQRQAAPAQRQQAPAQKQAQPQQSAEEKAIEDEYFN